MCGGMDGKIEKGGKMGWSCVVYMLGYWRGMEWELCCGWLGWVGCVVGWERGNSVGGCYNRSFGRGMDGVDSGEGGVYGRGCI